MSRTQRFLAWAVASLVLALISLWYLNPHFMLDLTDALWSCF